MGVLEIASALGGPVQTAMNVGYDLYKTGRSEKWQEKMYGQQLSDNIKLWNMNNEYNSPAAQRQRLESAGLNSALMYGGSGSGGVSASTPGSAKPGSPDYSKQKIDFLSDIYNTKLMKAEVLRAESIAEREKMITDAWKNIESLEVDIIDPTTGKPTGKKTKLTSSIMGQWNQDIGKGISTLSDANWAESKNQQEYFQILTNIQYLEKRMEEIERTQGRNDKYFELARNLGYLTQALRLLMPFAPK